MDKLRNIRRFAFAFLAIMIIWGVTSTQDNPTEEQNTKLETAYALALAEKVHEEQKQLNEAMDAVEALNEHISTHTSSVIEKSQFYDIPLTDELQEYTKNLCTAHSVHYPLVLAIMSVESEYKHGEISEKNRNGTRDWGIMQINECNHEWLEELLGIDDWLDLRQNILAGIYILSQYTHLEENHAILMSYNNGPTGARELWTEGIHTTNYSREVIATMDTLELRWTSSHTATRTADEDDARAEEG